MLTGNIDCCEKRCSKRSRQILLNDAIEKIQIIKRNVKTMEDTNKKVREGIDFIRSRIDRLKFILKRDDQLINRTQ
ncbi:hypothetical protein BLOT_011830 [Blomia tropicalis]|nr:hypothetical protein BLOT_011830 [Blomia tropicalis]